MVRRFLVIYETGPNHLSAYVPDVPGCTSIGHSLEELRENIHDELEFYLERVALEGRSVQAPIMGMDDVAPSVHAEWMMVKPAPMPRTLSQGAKVRRALRRTLSTLLNWVSRVRNGMRVRTNPV